MERLCSRWPSSKLLLLPKRSPVRFNGLKSIVRAEDVTEATQQKLWKCYVGEGKARGTNLPILLFCVLSAGQAQRLCWLCLKATSSSVLWQFLSKLFVTDSQGKLQTLLWKMCTFSRGRKAQHQPRLFLEFTSPFSSWCQFKPPQEQKEWDQRWDLPVGEVRSVSSS